MAAGVETGTWLTVTLDVFKFAILIIIKNIWSD